MRFLSVRFPGTPKAFDARVALLTSLAAAARLHSQGPGLGRRLDPDGGEKSPPPLPPAGTEQPVPHEGVQIRNGTSDAALGVGFGSGPGTGPGAEERAAAERAERAERTADAVVDAAKASKFKGLARAQARFEALECPRGLGEVQR